MSTLSMIQILGQKIRLTSFRQKSCLLGAPNIVKNRDKSKYVYRGYGIAIDGLSLQNFGNEFAGNAIIIYTGNSLSSHSGKQ